MKAKLTKLVLKNEKLKENLLELHREVETVGMKKAEYVERMQATFSEAGTELTKEEVESLMQPSEVQLLSSDDLENVAGGCGGDTCYNGNWCPGYNKGCPEATAWCDVYCS